MPSNEDNGHPHQQCQEEADPDNLEQVRYPLSSGRRGSEIVFPNCCEQDWWALCEHFHYVNRLSAGTSATAS